jgi:serine/threonine protein phosphatase PrpC
VPIAFHYAARSHVGLVRTDNQDSGYAGPHLLVVADGVGGHAGGDIASSVAIGQLVELDGESLGGREASQELGRAIASANTHLGGLVDERPELRGMGTTVTALLRSRNTLTLAHIGDSRAYLLRGDRFTQITRDHTFVQALIDEGRITEDEASSHPQRNLVTRVLTGEPDDEPDLGVREASPGDRYLLCSDGLSGFVATDTIEEILGRRDAPGRTADTLIELALKAGAPDNVTVIVADVVDLQRADAPPTQPQIVGAASIAQGGTRALPVSPAEKAAALARDASGDGGVTLAEEGGHSRLGRVLRAVGALVAVLVVLAAGTYAAYEWTQRQVFVGEDGGQVAIFHGVSQKVGPFALSSVDEVTSIDVDDLPEYFRTRVEETVTVDSQEDAQQLVADLRDEADACVIRRERGQECGTETGPSQTPTPTSPTFPTLTSSTSPDTRSTTRETP